VVPAAPTAPALLANTATSSNTALTAHPVPSFSERIIR
jgi:hypothetical protein